MADMTTTQIKAALLYKKQEVVDLLSDKVPPSELRLGLWQAGVLTDDEQARLGDTCDREGPLGHARQLVDIVLTREEQLQTFHDELQELCTEAHALIKDNADVLDRISTHISATYKARNCHLIQVLPGEKLQLDLHRAEYVMPLVISAEKIVRRERQGHWLPESEVKHEYRGVDIASVEGVLKAMYQKHESTVLCLGIAGVGKTICAKKVLSDWVDWKGAVKFQIVVVVPVRDVTISRPIVDIIGEGEGNLGLVSAHMKQTLEYFLQDESIASYVLIIVDGIDERDIPASSELYQFITGQKYPHVKKMITCRPEAAILYKVTNFYPDYKVTVEGTSREGVYGYLQAVMTDDDTQPTDDKVHSLIAKCENEMIEFNLLHIPLYLTFVGFIFNFHWAQHCTFANFIIPATTTKLFTSFITIIIRIWLKKIGRIQEFKDEIITFKNNPIGTESKIPKDIKRVLIFGFGKLSYDFIEKQQYNFTESDLDEYLIDVEDIKQSGMFCMAEEQGQLQCFYRHKTLQEYMAALYLSHVQFESESFSRYLLPESDSNKKVLLHIFSKLSIVLKFVFGMEAKFASQIIQKLKGNVSVSTKHGDININYEASLYNETENPDLSQAMLDLLTDTIPIKIEGGSSFQCSTSIVHALCQAFSPTQTHTLLENWFGLTVYQHGEEWGLSHTGLTVYQRGEEWGLSHTGKHTDSLHIESLTHVLYVLALKHQYHQVQTLSMDRAYMSDIILLLELFPKLKYLNVNGPIFQHNCTSCDSLANKIRHDTIYNTSLTHVNVSTDFSTPPLPFLQSVLLLSSLQSLRLRGELHPLCEAVATGPVSWGSLTELELCMWDDDKKQVTDIVETSMLLLKNNTPQLKAFTLGRAYVTLNQISPAIVLDALITTPRPALTTLRLFDVLNSEGVLALCDHLPPGVHTLGLGWEELADITEQFMQKVSLCCPGVTDIHVGYTDMYDVNFRSDAVLVLHELKSHRPTHPIQVCIQLGIYELIKQKYESEAELLAIDQIDNSSKN